MGPLQPPPEFPAGSAQPGHVVVSPRHCQRGVGTGNDAEVAVHFYRELARIPDVSKYAVRVGVEEGVGESVHPLPLLLF